MWFDEQIRLMARVDVLEPLSEEEIEDLARRKTDVHLGAGEIFSNPDEHEEQFLILKQGKIRIYRQEPGGQQQTLAQIGAGTSISAQRLQGSYAEVVEPSTIITLTFEDVRRLIGRNAEVGMRLIRLLIRRLNQCDERLSDVTLKEVPARLASLISTLVEDEGIVTPEGLWIPNHYTHEQLGAMIGARRVAVSRAFSRLRRAGAIETRRRYIYVRDEKALRRIAGEARVT
jgi:CRP/FNR family transcriptional regulator